ncbi:MAG: GNAT family N-acetyltransferase [Chloroflexota bacterium]
MKFTIRNAQPADLDAILALMPRLASFDLPARRAPKDLWQGDAQILQEWMKNQHSQFFAFVAVSQTNDILGAATVSMRKELLSQAPSAHLEALVVAAEAEGLGVGKGLMAATEAEAQERGAKSMSLNVISTNHRARRLYAKSGYHEEMIRNIKFF